MNDPGWESLQVLEQRGATSVPTAAVTDGSHPWHPRGLGPGHPQAPNLGRPRPPDRTAECLRTPCSWPAVG